MSTKTTKKQANKKAKRKQAKKDGLADLKRLARNKKAREQRAAKKQEKLNEENAEKKRLTSITEGVTIPVSNEMEPEGSHSIDHGTIMDNHIEPDTNKHPAEDLKLHETADLSFWNNSWCWVEAANSYGNKPQDKWFINPTSELIGKVMLNAPTIMSACEVGLIAGQHVEQLKRERERHVEFLRTCEPGDIVSEALDMLTAYQGRYFECVQRYLGLEASYHNQQNSKNISSEQLENAQLRKHNAGGQCRSWAAKLIALVEGYNATVSDERAFKLSFDFAPLPPDDNRPPTREYSLYKWSVTNTLNKVGRRLARSIKEGKMDAEKYRIPRPWLEESQLKSQVGANELLSDFA